MKGIYSKVFFFKCILLVLYTSTTIGQVTKVRGVVFDEETNEPIPFVNVIFQGTSVGTTTDFNGAYFLENRIASDTLVISYMGYTQTKRKIIRNSFQEINVKLQSENIQLEEISIEAPENPAHAFFRKVIENKELNNPQHTGNYKCEAYNKLEFDISNIDESLKDKAFFKQFPIIFDYVDTSAITGSSYLPVFMSESISEYYYQSKPKAEKEIITGSKISGIKNESISQFTGDMYLSVPIYDNYLDILGKSFISPVANFGMMYYKYYLIDSSFINDRWCYLLSFKPKSRQEPTFTGKMWIHDTTYAIANFEIRINENANVNFVNDLVVSHNYQFVNDSIWLIEKEKIFLDFNIAEKTYGIHGHKTSSYKNYALDIEFEDKFFSGSSENIEVIDGASDHDEEFWSENRHEDLTSKEESTYHMMDTITNMPVFKTYIDIIRMFMTGYKDFNKWELGPYYTMYSYNEIEGHRFRIGGRTTDNFNDTFRYGLYAAMGSRDKDIKYGGTFEWLIKKQPQQKFMFSYKNDLEQLGQSPNALREDNIMSSFFRRTPNNKLTWIEEYNSSYNHDWNYGFSNTIYLIHRELSPSEFVTFDFLKDGQYASFDNLHTAEIKLSTRWAYNEKYIYNSFERTSVGTQFPTFTLDASFAVLNQYSTPKPYYKLRLGVDHNVKTNPLGYFNYKFEAGKVFGTLPYPLLELHKGNETYTYDDYAFNLMNYYEFVSDEFISLGVTHHFDGFFFNKVPLFKRLKLREVVTGKAVIGRISNNNIKESVFPETLHALSTPYAEGGVGIENIFKIFRVDAIWRFTHKDENLYPNISEFGIRLKIQFMF